MSSIFPTRRAQRRQWDAEDSLVKEGPICAAVQDVRRAAREATHLLSAAQKLLRLSNRSDTESNLRGCLFYFWCRHTGTVEEGGGEDEPQRPLNEWEASLNSLSLEEHVRVIDEIRTYVCLRRKKGDVRIVARLEHLERIVFHAWRLSTIKRQVIPPTQDARDTVTPWLAKVAVYCQSDAVQRKCRELYLLLAVSPYDMERTASPNAFSCLCTVDNASVNTLVERAGAPLQAVVREGFHKHPFVFALAALCVFCEFVRCKRALDMQIHTLHSATTAAEGAFLVERTDSLYLRTHDQWEGPYNAVGLVLTRWEDLHGNTPLDL